MREVMIAKRSLLAAMGASALLCAVPLSSAFAADAKGSPDEWIVELSNKILGDIRADAKLAQADPARVRKFVDEQIMPVVDFERMTRTAVGPKWRQATKEQRKELMELFREQRAHASCVARQARYADQLSIEEGKGRVAHYRRRCRRHLDCG